MDHEKLEIEDTNFEYLVLGTDLPESIVGAALASRGHSCLNIDSDFMYSGTLKTLNMRELKRFIDLQAAPGKDHLIRDLKIEFCSDRFDSLDKVIETLGFRSFNFDFEPKFIYSDSYATKELIAIGVDNYISFRPIKDVSISCKGEVQKLPLSKSLLMKTKVLSFKEKKALIETVEVLQKFVQRYLGEADLNSIKDFEKEIYSLEMTDRFVRLKESLDLHHSHIFKILFGESSTRLVEDFIRYAICSCKLPIEADQSTCREVLTRFSLFIKSSGVHDMFPYLYPVYGIGDLSQVFSRIAALSNAIFLINPLFEIASLIKQQENGGYELHLSQGEHSYTFNVKKLIVGQQYARKIKELLAPSTQGVPEVCKKVLLICENKQDNSEVEYPIFAAFPEQSEGLGNKNPINVYMFGPNTHATKDRYFFLHISYMSSEPEEYTQSELVKSIVSAFNKSKQIELEPHFFISFDRLMEHVNQFESFDESVFYAPSFGQDVTIESAFVESQRFLQSIGILASADDRLVIKKQPDNDTNYKSNDDKLIEELKEFKFD